MNRNISEKEHRQGQWMIAVTALLWGLAGVCVKSICWNSLSITAIRSLASLLFIGLVRKSFRIKFTRRNILGALFSFATSVLYMAGIKHTDAGTAIVLQYTAPIFILLIDAVLYRKRPSLRESAIVAIVFFGCVLSFLDNMSAGHLFGNLLSLASGLTYAFQIVLFTQSETDPDSCIMLSNLMGVVFCAPFMFFDEGIAQTTPNVVFWIAVMCIFQYAIANFLYTKGCKRVGDLECSLLLTLEPLFNPIPVALICGEMMGTKAIIGFVIVLAGVILYTLTSKKTS